MRPMRVALAQGFRAASYRFTKDHGGGCLTTCCRPAGSKEVLEGLAVLQRRSFAAEATESRGTSKAGPLISGKDVNVGKMAGALANQIRESGACRIDCIGAMPIYSAVKAVNIASGYLEDSHPGQRLCIHHEWVTQPASEAPAGIDTKLLRFHVKPVTPPSIKDEPELIMVSAKTNTGLAAGLISRVIEQSGGAALSCMGSASVTNAVKAMGIAQSYLAKRDALGDNKVVGAVVRTEKFMDGNEERTRMILSCMQIADPTKD